MKTTLSKSLSGNIPKTLSLTAALLIYAAGPASEAKAMSVKDYQNSIVEVVIDKPDDSAVVYDRAYPLDKIPFKQRTDKYQSIGTAWFLNNKTLVSAAHVITYQTVVPGKSIYVRNIDGNIFEISNIVKYDSKKDLVAFELKTYPKAVKPLPISTVVKIGDATCAPGNALGEGISLRCSGEVSSFQPEPEDGRWQEVYFSTPVSPGNSGGPLLNKKNQVIGVVVRKIEDQSLNIATPIKELSTLSNVGTVDLGEVVIKDKAVQDLRASIKIMVSKGLPSSAKDFFDNVRKELNASYVTLSENYRKKSLEVGFYSNPENIKNLVQDTVPLSTFRFAVDPSHEGQWIFKQLEDKEVTLKNDEKLRYTRFDESMYYVSIPHFGKSDELLKNPKRLMDGYLKTKALSREIANDRYYVTSLGEGVDSYSYADSLKRPWVVNRYVTGYTLGFLDLACTPTVVELTCFLKAVDGSLSLKNISLLESLNQEEFIFPYKGSSDEWLVFQKQEIKPEFISRINIEAKDGSVSISAWGFNYSVETRKSGLDQLAIGFYPGADRNPRPFQIGHTSKDSSKTLLVENFSTPSIGKSSGYSKSHQTLKELSPMKLTKSKSDKPGEFSVKISEDKAELIGAFINSSSEEESKEIYKSFRIDPKGLAH